MTSASASEPHGFEPARPPRHRRGEVVTYGQGRTCASPGCHTMLSRYNKDAICWTHADERERARERDRR
jgi:hypothetical protein